MGLLAAGGIPPWLPALLLIVPIALMLWGVSRAIRSWMGSFSTRTALAIRRLPNEVELGSVGLISDPSGYRPEALLKAMAINPEPQDGRSAEEIWVGYAPSMLGLRCWIPSGYLDPNLLWGERNGRQLFIRVGRDERIQNDPNAIQLERHIRQITVLRVDSQDFQIDFKDGRPDFHASTPAEVREIVSGLAPDPLTWGTTRLTGGPQGIVAARPGADPANALLRIGWVYDLWLCEQIADRLTLEPLPSVKLGRSWKGCRMNLAGG